METALQPKRTIWVSYAGADRNLVHSLTRYWHQYDWSANDKGENSITESQQFRLLTYLRDDQGKPVEGEVTGEIKTEVEEGLFTFLKPGESIEELIRTIAANPRRALFISETYLNSEYCLKELLYCLCREPFVPMLLVIIDFGGDFKTMRTARVYSKITGDSNKITLDEALAKLYLRICHTLPEEFRLRHPEEQRECKADEIQSAITKQLNKISDRLMLTPGASDVDEDSIILVSDTTVRALFRGGCDYNRLMSSERVLQQYRDGRRQRIKNWFASSKLNPMLSQLNYKADSLADSLINHAFSSQFLVWLDDFCKKLVPQIRKEREARIAPPTHQLQDSYDWGFLLLQIIENAFDPVYLAELRFTSLASSPMRISRVQTKNQEYQRAIDELLALSAVATVRGKRLHFESVQGARAMPAVGSLIRLTPVAPEEKATAQHNPTHEILRQVYDIPYADVPATIKELPPEEIRAEVHDYMDYMMLDGTFTLLGDLAPLEGTSQQFYDELDKLQRFFNSDLGDDPNADPPLYFPTVLFGLDDCEQLPVMKQGLSRLLKHCTRIIKEINADV